MKHECGSRAAAPAPAPVPDTAPCAVRDIADHVFVLHWFFFFLLVFRFPPTCVDSCWFGPNWIVLVDGWNWLKQAKKGWIRLKTALNQAKIIVKIINKKKLCKTLCFELWSSLPTTSLVISLSVSPLSLINPRPLTQKSESLLCLTDQAHSSSLGLNLSIMECLCFKLGLYSNLWISYFSYYLLFLLNWYTFI